MAELADAADSKADFALENKPNARNRIDESAAVDPSTGNNGNSSGTLDAVEAALAHALDEATKAQRWDVVAQVAEELQARRLAKSANVVSIKGARRRGGES